MSLQGIFDPVVMAYYKKKFGGGSAVDDGYCVEWDGNQEGRDSISIDGIPLFFKVSNLIIDLQGCTVIRTQTSNGQLVWQEVGNIVLQIDGGTVACEDYASEPVVFSGKAGDYTFMGISFTVPSDGTYFSGVYGICKLCKSTTL